MPAASAVAAYALARRMQAAETAERSAAALAMGVAILVGYLLLASWADLALKRHWHWMPYLALAASVIGPITVAGGVQSAERWTLSLLAALVAASLLVPHWASLQPSRAVLVPSLGAYLGALAIGLEPLARRVSARMLLASLALAAMCVALLIATFVSLTYARLAVCTAAALLGCWIACLFVPGSVRARGIGLTYSLAVGGWAFVGCIDPPKPLLGLLIAPVAPLTLWVCKAGPLVWTGGLVASIVPIAAELIVLGIAAGIVAAAAGVI